MWVLSGDVRITLVIGFLYSDMREKYILPTIPNWVGILWNSSKWLTESKALQKSIKQRKVCKFSIFLFLKIVIKEKMWSMQERALLKPF